MKMRGQMKVYAVRRGEQIMHGEMFSTDHHLTMACTGRQVGLFTSYEDVTQQTYGFPGAQHKSFLSVEEAEEYLREGGLHVTENGMVMQLQPMALRTDGAEETLSSSLEAKEHAQLVIESLRARSYSFRQRMAISPTEIYTLFFDGACRGNPGYSGAGCVILSDMGETVAELCASMPYGSTNNEAEFGAAFLGLHTALNLGIKHIVIKGDSQLVIKILAGQSKVRHPRLQPYFFASSTCLSRMTTATAEQIPREQNARADILANKAIDDSFF
jgi:ribonuclease HI